MPKPVKLEQTAPVKHAFKWPALEDAVIWGLMQGTDYTEAHAQLVVRNCGAPNALKAACEHVFIDGWNPRQGRPNLLRLSLAYTNRTGLLPTSVEELGPQARFNCSCPSKYCILHPTSTNTQ